MASCSGARNSSCALLPVAPAPAAVAVRGLPTAARSHCQKRIVSLHHLLQALCFHGVLGNEPEGPAWFRTVPKSFQYFRQLTDQQFAPLTLIPDGSTATCDYPVADLQQTADKLRRTAVALSSCREGPMGAKIA